MDDEEKADRCGNANQGEYCRVYSRKFYDKKLRDKKFRGCKDCSFSVCVRGEYLWRKGMAEEARGVVQCAHCTTELLSEYAYMRNKKTFCDKWCADHFQEFDTEQTSKIVCPFCGYAFDESYEYIGEDMVECDDCGKRFELETEEHVYYTTRKPDWLRLWREYNREQIYRAEWRIANGVV